MKKLFVIAIAAVMVAACEEAPQFGGSSLDKVVGAMTLKEKVHFVLGTGCPTEEPVKGAAGTTYAIPRLGIPAITLADGPAGVRTDDQATRFPNATLLASAWDTELTEKVGEAIGQEALAKGIDVMLAPAMNIQRHPLCGRNFEYYSEDPLVSGKNAAAYVRGIQSTGVDACLKHFACNNQETFRTGNCVIVHTRPLREIYLKGFEIAVKESNPRTVMTSYNKINGEYTSQSSALLDSILRDEWGFKGLVMSDWGAGDDAVAQIIAGNDMIQPGNEDQYKLLMKALKNGSLTEEQLDKCVRRVLKLVAESASVRGIKGKDQDNSALARESARDGMVLLENNGALPFKNVKKVALFGSELVPGGTGSGSVNGAATVSLAEGLGNAGIEVEKGEDFEALAANNDIAVVTISRISGEGSDRSSADFALSEDEKQLLAVVSRAFRLAKKKVVVVLNVGGVIETTILKWGADAILLAWQPGQEAGNAVADILTGAVNPSGKLPVTFPMNLSDVLSTRNFPVDVVWSETAPADTVINNVHQTRYDEGIYVGYRWFDRFNLPVAYPFGYGLSYTSFAYSKPEAANNGTTITAKVTVKNTGKVSGREVVQLYVSAPNSQLDKPVKELKAFAKTKLLEPGQSQVLEFSFPAAELASFSEKSSAWKVDEGKYTIQFAASSRDVRCKATVSAQAVSTSVHDVLPNYGYVKLNW